MNARGIINVLVTLVVVAILIGIGVGIYNSGVQQGILEAGRVPAGGAVAYGYQPGWFGFGFLGLLFPLFFLFLIFGLVRAAFGGGYRRGGWGGHGYGSSSWDSSERDRRMAEMHQRLHEAGDRGGSSTGSGGSSGSSASMGSDRPA